MAADNKFTGGNLAWPFQVAIGLLIVICVGALFPMPPRTLKMSEQSLRRVMVESFVQAVCAHQLRYGDDPFASSPESIRRHLRVRFDGETVTGKQLDRIAELDGAEKLVFWLTDAVADWYPDRERMPFIDLDAERLIDQDRDGFPSCVAGDGNEYHLANDVIRVYSDSPREFVFSEPLRRCGKDLGGGETAGSENGQK